MKKVSLIVLFLVLPMIAAAAEKSIWIIAEGESQQGEMDTLMDVKERAKHNAETTAVEKAVGTFIKTHTLLSNNQIAEDLVYAATRGKIISEEIVSSDWDIKDRKLYKVKIRALVEQVYPEKGDSLYTSIYLSKSLLKEGEDVEIYYQTNKDCYAYIFSIAADGSVTLLFPNSIMTDNFIKADTVYRFPSSDYSIHLKAMFLPNFKENTAEEKVKIITTRKKEDLLPLGFKEGIFQVYDSRSTGMINDLVKRLNQIEPTDWTEAAAIYTIKR